MCATPRVVFPRSLPSGVRSSDARCDAGHFEGVTTMFWSRVTGAERRRARVSERGAAAVEFALAVVPAAPDRLRRHPLRLRYGAEGSLVEQQRPHGRTLRLGQPVQQHRRPAQLREDASPGPKDGITTLGISASAVEIQGLPRGLTRRSAHGQLHSLCDRDRRPPRAPKVSSRRARVGTDSGQPLRRRRTTPRSFSGAVHRDLLDDQLPERGEPTAASTRRDAVVETSEARSPSWSACSSFVLVGILAFVADFGFAYANQRQLQNAVGRRRAGGRAEDRHASREPELDL